MTLPRPTLSVIMPSFNCGEFLELALASVRGLPNTQVVVQDGGSTDNTSTILARECELNPRITIAMEPDDGQADALNKALARAQGRYIGWLNADDFYFADGIRSVLRIAETGEGAPEVIYGDFALVDRRGMLLRRYASREWSHRRFLTHGCYIFSGATFWRSDVLKSLGFDTGLGYVMDLDLFLRAGERVAVHIPTTVGALRIHPSSKTSTEGFRFASEAFSVQRKWAGKDAQLGLIAYWNHLVGLLAIASQPIRMNRLYARLRGGKTL